MSLFLRNIRRGILFSPFLLLVVLSSSAFAQLDSMQDLDRIFIKHRDSKYFSINKSNNNCSFFTYSHQPRKNARFLTKSEISLNMDRSIEGITNNDGIGSYRYMTEALGYSGFIEPYKARISHPAAKSYDASHNALSLVPDPYYIHLLTAPLAERKRRREQFINSVPTRTPFYYPPAVSAPTPLPILDSELEERSELPIVQRSAEQVAEIPVLRPPQYNPSPNIPAPIPPDRLAKEKTSILELPPVSIPDRIEPAHRSPVQLLYDQGLEAFDQRNYPKAKQLFEKILSLSPDTIHTQFAHGLSLFYSGDYRESLDALQRSYCQAQKQNIPAVTLWQIPINTQDFRYHYKKLVRRIQQKPDDPQALPLMLLLTQTGFTQVSSG